MTTECKQGRETTRCFDVFYHIDNLRNEMNLLGSPCRGPHCGEPTAEEVLAWIEHVHPENIFYYGPSTAAIKAGAKPCWSVRLEAGDFVTYEAPTFLDAVHQAMKGKT